MASLVPKPVGNPPYAVNAKWPFDLLAKVLSRWEPNRVLCAAMRALITQGSFSKYLGRLLCTWWNRYKMCPEARPIGLLLRDCWLPLLRGEQVASANLYERSFGHGYESANKMRPVFSKRRAAQECAAGFMWINWMSHALLRAWEWRGVETDVNEDFYLAKEARVAERLQFYYGAGSSTSNVRAMALHEYLNLLPHNASVDNYMERLHGGCAGTWLRLAHNVSFSRPARVHLIDAEGWQRWRYNDALTLHIEACLRTRLTRRIA